MTTHAPAPADRSTTRAEATAHTPILAKIVATIGPASESPEMVARLIEAGVGIFRFNFSHGSFDEHERRLATVRTVAKSMGRTIGCMGDLPGPKIRVGKVAEPGIELRVGDDVEFATDLTIAEVVESNGSRLARFPTTYPNLIDDVLPGQRVLINDGAIRMLAVEGRGGALRCCVTVGGLVTSNKGINLPESDISAPAITPKDWTIVEWAVRHGLDFLALSFVRSPKEIATLQDRLWSMCSIDKDHADAGHGSMIPVIAKIEKPQAVAQIDAIVQQADGIMVARGDLGVEMDIAQVPHVQKQIIASCERFGTPCIVATQMLETMIERSIPTRAEASDVANAILDGAGAVMLSGETAVGKHPALVVETMRRIIEATERTTARSAVSNTPAMVPDQGHELTAALAHAAVEAAQEIGAAAVACWSQNGGTARYLSQNKLAVPILACSSNLRATRRMTLLRGVTPLHLEPPASGTLADWNEAVDEHLVRLRLAPKGTWAILLAGLPLGKAKRTNTLTIHRVGEGSTGYRSMDAK